MKDIWMLLTSLVVFLTSGPPAAAAAPPCPEPLKGVVAGGAALVCVRDSDTLVYAWNQLLHGEGRAESVFCTSSDQTQVRWQVGHGALWINFNMRFFLHQSDGLDRYELAELLQGRRFIAPGAEIKNPFTLVSMGRTTPIEDKWSIATFVEFYSEVYYDYLPSQRFDTRVFVRANASKLPQSNQTRRICSK